MTSAGPLVLDEHGSYWIIDPGAPGTSLSRSLDYAAIPPLSSWLQAVFIAVFGKSEFVFRLPSALCYLAAIALTWRVGCALGDRTAGGIAALILAWHPEALDEVRIARCYGLVLLLSAALLWVSVCWLSRPRSWAWSVGWGIAAAGLMWTHYTAAPLIACIGLSLLFLRSPASNARLPLRTVVLAGVVLILLSFRLLPAIQRLREWSPFLNYMSGEQPLWTTIGPLWWLGLPAGCLVAWCGRQLLGSTGAGNRAALLRLAVWTLIPLALLALMARGDMTSLANPRYRVPYAVGGACLIAYLLSWCGRHPAALFAAAVTTVSLGWWHSGTLPWQLGRLGDPTDAQWKLVSDHIERVGIAGEPLFVQSGLIEAYLVPVYRDDPQFMDYVACRAGRFYIESPHPRYALPFLWDADSGVVGFFEERLRSIAADAPGSFWVASATDTDLNRASLAGIQAIAEQGGYEVVEEQRQPAVTLLRYLQR